MHSPLPCRSRRDFLIALGLGGLAAVALGGSASASMLGTDPAPIAGIPGATGFGSRSWGGTSPFQQPSRVAVVTRLDDYGSKEQPIPGTLRYVVAQPGPRIVCLARSGTIRLKGDLVIEHPYITIVGHLAPPPGVVISQGRVVVKTHDVILSDLKIRAGDFETGSPLSDRDCLTLWGRKDGRWGEVDSVERILINRCSLSFSCDELFSTYQHVRAVTMQRCLLSHALRYTNHEDIDRSKPADKKNHHSMGALINPDVQEFSLIDNVFAHTLHRMPRIIPGATGEIINNIFYGYGSANGDRLYMEDTKSSSREQAAVRVVGNLWIPVKGVSGDGPIVAAGKTASASTPSFKLVFKDNAVFEQNGSIHSRESGLPSGLLMETDTTVRPKDPAEPEAADKLEPSLLNRVGARSNDGSRDPYDESVINSVQSRSGGPVDTVVPGRTSLNGFAVTNARFEYPPEGGVAKLSPPFERQRPKPLEYSPLERWLWNTKKARSS